MKNEAPIEAGMARQKARSQYKGWATVPRQYGPMRLPESEVKGGHGKHDEGSLQVPQDVKTSVGGLAQSPTHLRDDWLAQKVSELTQQLQSKADSQWLADRLDELDLRRRKAALAQCEIISQLTRRIEQQENNLAQLVEVTQAEAPRDDLDTRLRRVEDIMGTVALTDILDAVRSAAAEHGDVMHVLRSELHDASVQLWQLASDVAGLREEHEGMEIQMTDKLKRLETELGNAKAFAVKVRCELAAYVNKDGPRPLCTSEHAAFSPRNASELKKFGYPWKFGCHLQK